jgi:hypothetical protein
MSTTPWSVPLVAPRRITRAALGSRLPAIALVAVALAAFAVFVAFPTYPAYDSLYSLVWGREVLAGAQAGFDG